MMKHILLALLLISTLLACDKKNDTECRVQICTEEFRSLSIKFLDNLGAAAEVKNFSVINQRTGEKVSAIVDMPSPSKGTYMVVNDGNTKSLSENGDELKITATSVVTNQKKSAIIKVKGGNCACHIEKVSGPDQIIFD